LEAKECPIYRSEIQDINLKNKNGLISGVSNCHNGTDVMFKFEDFVKKCRGAEYLYLQKTRVWFFVDKSKDGLLLAKGIDPIGTKSILMKGRVVHYSKQERLGKKYVSLELNPNHSTDCVCFHARHLQGCHFKEVQLNDVMEFKLIESERGVVAVDKIHQQAEIARKGKGWLTEKNKISGKIRPTSFSFKTPIDVHSCNVAPTMPKKPNFFK